MREFLVHLNVQTDDDTVAGSRSLQEICDAIEGAIAVGSDHPSLEGLEIVIAMAEEI